MSRVFLITICSIISLYSQGYEDLLSRAIENSTELQIIQNREREILLKGEISIRKENPNLELEIADFSSKRVLQENELGTRVGVSHSLLLPSVKADRQQLTQSRVDVAQEQYQVKKAELIYSFNIYYLDYKEALKRELLEQEEVVISKKILDIASHRFNAGSIARGELLQAKIGYQEALSLSKLLAIDTIQRKNSLLLFAKVTTYEEIQSDHIFSRSSTTSTHPLVRLTEKKEEVANAELALATHTIDEIELFSEIEFEPDQDIFRVGITLPLPIFNQKSQEKQLAQIAINNQRLTLASQQRALELEIPQLQKEITIQEDLQSNYQALVSEQENLLEMYQKAYGIAKVNLLKLQEIKRQLMSSKTKILESTIAIEQNSIKINYLQGAYNE